MKVYYHADDFGIDDYSTDRFIDAVKNGKLNLISIFVNTKEIDKTYIKLKENKVKTSLHLNVVEGKSLSDKKLIPHLVDSKGNFNLGFGKLLLYNFSFKRKIIKNELYIEIKNQLSKYIALTNQKKIYVDSHRHYHMVPIFMDALLKACNDLKVKIDYIRIPLDPLKPIVTVPKMFFKVKPLNWVKWILLKVLYIFSIRSKIKKNKIYVPTFMGLFFTCEMSDVILDTLYPKYYQYAKKHNYDLEIMFHPGRVKNQTKLLDKTNHDFVEFYMSSKRDQEYHALLNRK